MGCNQTGLYDVFSVIAMFVSVPLFLVQRCDL